MSMRRSRAAAAEARAGFPSPPTLNATSPSRPWSWRCVFALANRNCAVRSCCVIGLPDEDKGNRVHAIVEADPAAVAEADLIAFVAERLARYKVPRTVELVDEALRDDAGKMRRSELRRQRLVPLGEGGG